MDPNEKAVHLKRLVETFRLLDLEQMEDDRLYTEIEKEVRKLAIGSDWSLEDASGLADLVYAGIRGYDILDELLNDPSITEIMVNAYDRIFIERSGEIISTTLSFESEQKYVDILQRMVSDAGREVNQRVPVCDFRLKDGSRVNIVLNPIAYTNTLTIRRFRDTSFTLQELVANGTVSSDASTFLKQCVHAKFNIFICGSTGSGKTTFLNALSQEIYPTERLITIEDARELRFDHAENWVALETRDPNAQGKGEITVRDLIRASLRMRPDRIIVGEVRGEEAIDMLQALNTGHEGSFSTGHANSIRDMQFRLETMILSGSQKLPLQAVRQQIASAIDLFIYVGRTPEGKRRVFEIAECYWGGEDISYNPLFELQEELVFTGNVMRRREKFSRFGISNPLEGLSHAP